MPLSQVSSTEELTSRSDPGEGITVGIAESHPAIRKATCHVLDEARGMTVTARPGSVREGSRLIDEHGPGGAIIDLSLSGRLSFDFIAGLRGEHPRTDLLVFSVYKDTVYAEEALRVGASGYLKKRAPTAEILRAVPRVAEGRVYLSSEMNLRILERANFDR
jgi:DNA-binding NarL/FixJ family response regulator